MPPAARLSIFCNLNSELPPKSTTQAARNPFFEPSFINECHNTRSEKNSNRETILPIKMTKLTVTITVFLFVLALAQARTPLDLPANDVLGQESDPKPITTATKTILLPSEKFDSESEAVEEEAKPAGKPESRKPESESDDFVPLTVINFHPINRQFPRNPSLTLRHRRPCRHHHHPGKPFGFHHREISYGNDMLPSKGEKNEEVRQIPARWVKFHHEDIDGPRFPNWHDDGVGWKDRFRVPRHHRHQHFHHHRVEEEEKERQGLEHRSGFLMKIRKFLNQF